MEDAVEPAIGGLQPLEQGLVLRGIERDELVVACVEGGELSARRRMHDAVATGFKHLAKLDGEPGGKSLAIRDHQPVPGN